MSRICEHCGYDMNAHILGSKNDLHCPADRTTADEQANAGVTFEELARHLKNRLGPLPSDEVSDLIAAARWEIAAITRERNSATEAHARDLRECGVRIDEARADRDRVQGACNVLIDALLEIARMTPIEYSRGVVSGSQSLAAFHAARDAATKALEDIPMYLTKRTVKT